MHILIRLVLHLLWFICPVVRAEAMPIPKIEVIKTLNKQIVYAIEIDPRQFSISPVHAQNQAFGRENLQDIAKRHHAVLAINGGFFLGGESTNGLPAGILKIDKQWYGIAYRNRAAIGWCHDKQPITLIDRITSFTALFTQNKYYPAQALNRPSLCHQAILYTHSYQGSLNLCPSSKNILIENNHITAINTGNPNISVPLNGFLYSIGHKSKWFKSPFALQAQAELKVKITPQFDPDAALLWDNTTHIVGGSPLLINNGRLIEDFSVEKLPATFIRNRYARTAIGLLSNHNWLLVIVEHNFRSNGMTLLELSNFMYTRGCQAALNVDGGSSSALYIDPLLSEQLKIPPFIGESLFFTSPIGDAIIVEYKKN